MAWSYEDLDGIVRSVSSEELRRLAIDGEIAPETIVLSTSTGKSGRADSIKGVEWPIPPSFLSGMWCAMKESRASINREVSEWNDEQMSRETQAESREPVKTQAFSYEPRTGPVRQSNPGFFDLEFRDAITPTLVSALWTFWLAILVFIMVCGLGYLSYSISQTGDPVGIKAVKVIGGSACVLFFWLLLSILVRIVLEAAVVLFRIADYLKQISEK